MNKKFNQKRTLLIIISVLFFLMMVRVLFFHENIFPKMVDDIRKQTVPMFDSVNIEIQKENDFQDRIQLLIQDSNLTVATKIVDSSIKSNPFDGSLRIYKGMIYAKEGKYTQAIQAYDSAIFFQREEFPLVQGKKADMYVKLHDYGNAIDNYKKAAAINVYYNCKVAQTFETMKKKDSALKYYLMYQQDHPHDTSFNKKVSFLLGNASN